MNAFIKKEVRLLLPTFLIGCALAFSNLGFRFQTDGSLTNAWVFILAFVFSGAVAIMLALNSFGAEFSSGTFANLLAQPISRQKIWDTKIALLAGSLSIIAVCWSGCGILRLFLLGRELNLLDLFSGIITFGLVTFSGGLWTVLLLRQVAAAFWFTILAPGIMLVIVAAITAFTNIQDANFYTGLIVTVLGIYSLAGFFFARWLFFRAQDVQWSGGNIVMPELRGLSAWFSKTSSLRVFRPRAALIRKEIQLHQSQFVMAFVLLVLHLGVLATRSLLDLTKSPDLKFILESFWGLWLAMPLLVGCAALAEERKIGTLEGQLCLPLKRRTQFTIKLAVAFGLSLLLGVLIPLVLEGTRILPGIDFHLVGGEAGWVSTMTPLQANIVTALGMLLADLPLWSFVFVTLVICFVSFYVSTLARNTLQTLAPAVVGIMAAVAVVFGSFAPWNFVWEWLWQGPVGFIIGLPIIALAVLLLMFKNFQILRPDWRTGMRNLGVFALALLLSVFAASSVYHRFWENFSAFEPAHGEARLTLRNPAELNLQWSEMNLRLPDGKMWRSWWESSPEHKNPLSRMLGNFSAVIAPGSFLSNSNWLMIERGLQDLVGIKTDGTLWVSEKPMKGEKLPNGRWLNYDVFDHLMRFGTETNWVSCALVNGSMLLTKSDGTLWQWGDIDFNFNKREWPGLRNFSPQRVGVESNWAQVSREGYQTVFYKTDDSAWMTGPWDTNHLAKFELMPGWELHSVPSMKRGEFRSRTIISRGGSFMAGIANEGTFRIFADQHLRFDPQNRYGEYYWSPTNLLIGTGSNWLSVAGGWQKVITLKKDGTLWLWDFGRDWHFQNRDEKVFAADVQRTKPVRLGTHSDWISISGNGTEVVALAADGSLWYWPLDNTENSSAFYNGNSSEAMHPVLDISRKPQLLGNVFSKTE